MPKTIEKKMGDVSSYFNFSFKMTVYLKMLSFHFCFILFLFLGAIIVVWL